MIDKLGLDGLGGASVRKPEAVNKLTKLIEAAKNHIAAWGKHVVPFETNAATILELCALLEQAEEALQSWANTINYQYTGSREAMTHLQECDGQGQEALAAIKQWKEGT